MTYRFGLGQFPLWLSLGSPFIAGEVSRRQQWQLILGVPSESN
jgi:hypothetical protein